MPEQSSGDKGASPKCLRCGEEYNDKDLYCRHCGLEIRADAGAIETYLAKLVPLRVDAILKDRFRDQKVVEIETAELLADRALKWMKTIGYFAGIPLIFAAAILSFFGYKTYSDFQTLADRTSSLAQQVKTASDQFNLDKNRIEALHTSLTKADSINDQLQSIKYTQVSLQNELADINKRLFTTFSGKEVSQNTQSEIRKTTKGYIDFLTSVGFRYLNADVNILCLS